jgi:hypothetical protein
MPNYKSLSILLLRYSLLAAGLAIASFTGFIVFAFVFPFIGYAAYFVMYIFFLVGSGIYFYLTNRLTGKYVVVVSIVVFIFIHIQILVFLNFFNVSSSLDLVIVVSVGTLICSFNKLLTELLYTKISMKPLKSEVRFGEIFS